MSEDRSFRTELRISLKPVVVSLIVVGFLLGASGDFWPDPTGRASVRLLALLMYGLSMIGALLDSWKAWVGRWFTILALVGVVGLADCWLAVPGIPALMGIPTGLAAVLIGLPAAAGLAVGETALLLAVQGPDSAGTGQAAVGVALVAIWAVLGLMVAVYRPVYQLARSYGEYYERAQGWVREARDRRAELEQALADLADANTQLTRLNIVAQGLRQLADEARRAKEEFVANVSHELRTPLNMILGFTEMILQAPESYGPAVPPALLADLAVIHRNSEHLSSLIDDVLDLSQVDMGQMALTKEHVAFREIVEAAVTVVQPLFESKGLYLETEVQEDLPAILCDRTRIREVIVNLLSNAGRFTECGGVRVRVWQEGNDVVTSVTDTGPGIAAEHMGKLFQPFQQLDGSVPRRYGGSGLGLSISKQLIELHEGSIWVETKEGVGTTFFFRLPIIPPAPRTGDPSRWLKPQWEYLGRTRRSKAPVPVVRPRFVVLESGSSLQRLLARYMDVAEIVPVTSMKQALQEASHTPTQALLVNATSPVRAARCLAQARSLPAGTPVIICSVPGAREVANELGVFDYLVKPVTREDLLEALDRLNLRGKTILVVDDEPDAVRLFRRMLISAGRGYRVVRASDGQEALDVMRGEQIDAVLLDLVMPNLDGFRLLEVKSQDPALRGIPVIVISARDPMGQPVVTNAVTITQGEGLSMHHLLRCIEAVTRLLSPEGLRDGPVPQAVPAD